MGLLLFMRRRVALGPDLDPDAQSYITAVEAADGQALQEGVKLAISNFVVGCKTDGNWNAIKATGILSDARTLAGVLVPLVGAAPINHNFESEDYNQGMGLVGGTTPDGSIKFLDTGRANNADPQDDKHLSIYKTEPSTLTFSSYIAAQASTPVFSSSRISDAVNAIFGINTSSFPGTSYPPSQLGFMGTTRSSPVSYDYRADSVTTTATSSSNANNSLNLFVFCRNLNGSPSQPTNARLSFYSIGESLDLALLDARVTTLIAELQAAVS